MKCSLDISNFLEEISSLFPFCCFPLFLCIVHHQTHSQLSIIFAFPQPLLLSEAISDCPLLFPSRILDTFWSGWGVGRGSSSGTIPFCFFILSMGFSRQEYWSGFPFPPPVDHILSELFAMTHPSWMVLHGMAHSFIELHKPLLQDKTVFHGWDFVCNWMSINIFKIDRNECPISPFLYLLCRIYFLFVVKNVKLRK